ncbi:MAG TPA: ROK family protein [Gaiella sp.]|jgi:glucokinase|nr:ROK family protein [Gaiella sp.]
MPAADRNPRAAGSERLLGIDVGGTKVAAGIVDAATGAVLERRRIRTRPERGGAAVLADCAAIVDELGGGRLPVGIGLCELVDLGGRPASADTLDWRGLDVAAAFRAPRVVVESDVRAAALAEARLGAGAGVSPFLFAVVGTGASACLVVDGTPYRGARGEAIVLGAPPVEAVASGAALARAARVARAEDALADPAHAELVENAAQALGGTLAVLVNALDPALVVLGGGLGAEPAFRDLVARSLRAHVAYPRTPPLPVVSSGLGADAGLVGAALSAASSEPS